jgi:hypothetical protein
MEIESILNHVYIHICQLQKKSFFISYLKEQRYILHGTFILRKKSANGGCGLGKGKGRRPAKSEHKVIPGRIPITKTGPNSVVSGCLHGLFLLGLDILLEDLTTSRSSSSLI